MKREIMIMLAAAVSLGSIYMCTSVKQASAAEKKKLLRVGTYDSRCICIAYAHSKFASERYEKMKAESDAAKAAGDEQKVADMKAAGNKQQARQHLQGFGTEPVHEYLELVKDKLPQVAKTAGVDVIVSKWEFDYCGSDVETVDVTVELAKLFDPREKAYQWIEQMKDKKPISREKLLQLEKEHSH